MIKSTLCYIKNSEHLLMLYRNKKPHDPNAGKWVGIGGKFEPGETPDECVLREVFEETGLTLTAFHFHGVIEFRNDACPDEDMYLYSAEGYSGAEGDLPVINCNEGDARWIPIDEVLELNLWEGDRYFLEPLTKGADRINMRLTYSGDRLISVENDIIS